MTADYRRVEHFSPKATELARGPIRRRLLRVRIIEALSLLFFAALSLLGPLRWHLDGLRSLLLAVRVAAVPLALYVSLDRHLADCGRLLEGGTWSDVLHCRTTRRPRLQRRWLAPPVWTLVPREAIDPVGFTPFWPTRRQVLVVGTDVEVVCGGRLGRTVVVVDHARGTTVTGTLDRPMHRIKVFLPDGTVTTSRSAGSSAAESA